MFYRTLKVNETAVNAAKESADVARDALHVVERAYLAIETIEPYPLVVGKVAVARIRFRNKGRTPCVVTGVWGSLTVTNAVPAQRPAEDWGNVVVNTLLPEEFTHLTVLSDHPLTAAEHIELSDARPVPGGRARRLYAWGSFVYTDAFRNKHTLEFRTLVYVRAPLIQDDLRADDAIPGNLVFFERDEPGP